MTLLRCHLDAIEVGDRCPMIAAASCSDGLFLRAFQEFQLIYLSFPSVLSPGSVS